MKIQRPPILYRGLPLSPTESENPQLRQEIETKNEKLRKIAEVNYHWIRLIKKLKGEEINANIDSAYTNALSPFLEDNILSFQ